MHLLIHLRQRRTHFLERDITKMHKGDFITNTTKTLMNQLVTVVITTEVTSGINPTNDLKKRRKMKTKIRNGT
jgi:hypothetical protein